MFQMPQNVRYMATFSSTYHLSARGQLTSPRNESQEKQAERLLHHCMHELLQLTYSHEVVVKSVLVIVCVCVCMCV